MKLNRLKIVSSVFVMIITVTTLTWISITKSEQSITSEKLDIRKSEIALPATIKKTTNIAKDVKNTTNNTQSEVSLNIRNLADIASGLSRKNSLFKKGSYAIDAATLNILAVDPQTAKQMESFIKAQAEEFARSMVASAQYINTEEESYFKIPKNSNSTQIRQKFIDSIGSLVGVEKAEIIASLAGQTTLFPNFGGKDLEIYVSDDTNPSGQTLTYLTTVILDEGQVAEKALKFFTPLSPEMENPMYVELINKFNTQIKASRH